MELIEYTSGELFDIVVDTIRYTKRHQHYKETVDHARFCHQIMTGDDQKELLVKFKRENEKQEQQRIRITNSRTQYAAGKIFAVFDEVERSDNVVEVIRYDQESEANQKALEEIEELLDKFWGEQKAINYVYEAVKRLNFYDPNAFLIVNFTPFEAKLQKTDFVYPIEVYSEQAIRYEYSNGVLLYLLFYQEDQIEDRDDKGAPVMKTVKNYYLFAKDTSFEFLELPENYTEADLMSGYQIIEIDIINPGEQQEQPNRPSQIPHRTKNTKTFQYRQYDTKSKRIPVMRVGYMLDARTRNATCVSPLQKAEKLFYDLIWTKSEYDLAKALHWFYQKFIYAPECNYIDPHDNDNYCQRGELTGTGKKCPNCDGTGMLVHTTVQDVIILKMPNQAEEIVPLSNMVHYENIDISIGKHLQEDFKSIEADIFKAVFNSQAFDRSEIAVTATEKTLDLRAVKNALISFANQCSRVYKFIIEMAAIYTDNDEGLIIQHKHPRDFKLETIEDLVAKRKNAIDSGAPYHIIRNIDMGIMELQNQDNPEVLQMMMAREKFRPFREKNDTERMFILAALKAEDYHRILWMHFEEIMTEIQFEDKARGEKPWHMLPYPEQKAIIDAKVKAIQDEVKKEKEEAAKLLPFRSPFGQQQPEETEEDEETPEERAERQAEEGAAA